MIIFAPVNQRMDRIMLKMLLRLWRLQQRRNFHKRDAVVAAYLLFLYVVMGVTFFKSFTENGGSLAAEDMPATIGAGLVIGLLICDIIMKLVMKRDMTAMDDYVKSRPLPEGMWNRFLLVSNLLSFWNYVLPVLTLPVFIYLLSIPQAIVCFLLFLAFSLVDASISLPPQGFGLDAQVAIGARVDRYVCAADRLYVCGIFLPRVDGIRRFVCACRGCVCWIDGVSLQSEDI